VLPVVVQQSADESGIKELAVYADFNSSPVGLLDFERDVNQCVWSMPAPCQNVSDAEIPVDTRQLADGDHSFVVKAFDAAGNERVSTTHYATIKNAADPAPPTTPTPPAPTTPNDPGSSDGAGLPNGVSDGAGTDSRGTSATGDPTLRVAFDQNAGSRLKAKYGRMVTLSGQLRDSSGAAITNAQIDFGARLTKPGAKAQDLGAVRTDSTGAFSLKVATKLGSRQLRFAYRPQIGGAISASAQLQLDVIAPLTLRVSPKRVRNKHAVTFTGKLSAGPIPRRGKVVNLQVIVDGHWHTFATVRSSRKGSFKYRYRFRRTYGRAKYRFRARSRYEAAYPFIAGTSKTVRVRVN
jgi:hypothetical protein